MSADEGSSGQRPPDEGADRPPEADAPQPTPPARGKPDTGADARPAETAKTPKTPEPSRTPLTQQLGRVTVVVLAVLFGVFAVANAQHVDFAWIFGGTEVVTDADGERIRGGVPLIVLLLTAFVVGALVGSFATWQTNRARRVREQREARDRKRKG